MTSLWLAGQEEHSPVKGPPSSKQDADVVVVGAGITGLTLAVLLARAGKDVLVLEARHVGAGASGNTTGKISVLQGTKVSRVSAKHSERVVKDYLTGNAEGRDWLLSYCDEHGIPTQCEDIYTYAQSADGVPQVRDEYEACRAVGLPVDWVDDAGVPFPFHGGVRLRDQAQLDPVPVLHAMVAELEEHGGRILEGARVTKVSGLKTLSLVVESSADNFLITTEQLVLATGIPILDRGGFFAKMSANRSYCLAFDVPGEITRPMFLSADSPTRSIRYAPTPFGERLIVGGAGHQVGRKPDARHDLEELAEWTALHFPGAVQTHWWSAQDYSPGHELPYVGPILPGVDGIQVATGFDKWGLTNGVAAALALSARLLGGRMDWAGAFASWTPHEASGLLTEMKKNLEVGFHLAKGWLEPTPRHPELHEGQGVVTGPPWHLQAVSMVDGVTYETSPVCPHLGGIVEWNDASCSWECPLHGSRFAPDGSLLEGPATSDLAGTAK